MLQILKNKIYILENMLYSLKNKVNKSQTIAPYKVYTALLTQSGTDAPVATVLENTLEGTVTWTYDDVGMYLATCSGCFTKNKTMAILSLWGDDTATPRLGCIEWVSVNNIYLRLLSMAQNSDNSLGGSNILTSIEIRVYK